MEKIKAFDLDVNLKTKAAAGDVSPQTWTTIGQTIKQSIKNCKTFTCGCSLVSCSNCN
ncbi:FDLD family class I lanthipeptide [Bacillus cereus group sp. N21]|uniref:FDLD family class I lanthipeptide n=1 Tax=Bacillus cereus group sp. N21 TaxID=2794591 RepID=UPI0018F68D86|nr:FDLD family class I lanthipeptide [Bacillus cereus group sp. N21]MBJ8031170.1 FDLD family class I lanthipeptide [Bacillus cereus group sp. N21]